MNEEREAVQQQQEGPDETAGVEGEDTFAVFGEAEVQVEKRQKDAHRATVTSVSANTSDKGSHSVRVLLQSDDTGNEITWDIWVPITFAENTGLFLTKQLGIEDLPPGEPDPERPGKLKGNQRAHYGMSIRNSAGDASVQQLLSVAAKDGRRPGALAGAFNQETTFEEFCAALNETLEGLPLIVTRIPETSDDNPRGFLKVSRVYHQSIIEDPKAMKALAKYLKHWTVGE
jgi:hypothetical protein